MWDTRLRRDFFAAPLVAGGIQNQASIVGNRGANLLCKFATSAFCAHEISQYHRFCQQKKHAAWRAFSVGGSGGIRTHGTVRYN